MKTNEISTPHCEDLRKFLINYIEELSCEELSNIQNMINPSYVFIKEIPRLDELDYIKNYKNFQLNISDLRDNFEIDYNNFSIIVKENDFDYSKFYYIQEKGKNLNLAFIFSNNCEMEIVNNDLVYILLGNKFVLDVNNIVREQIENFQKGISAEIHNLYQTTTEAVFYKRADLLNYFEIKEKFHYGAQNISKLIFEMISFNNGINLNRISFSVHPVTLSNITYNALELGYDDGDLRP